MREIEFKAWHTVNKIMFSCEEMVEDQMTLLTDGRFINVSGTSTKLSGIDNSNVMIPLQYVGRRDKNGKKIHMGDVLLSEGEEGALFAGDNPFVVDFKDGYYIYFRRYEISEIIGNIYENPELKKKK